jgi:hypothetical protein
MRALIVEAYQPLLSRIHGRRVELAAGSFIIRLAAQHLSQCVALGPTCNVL